MRLEALSLCALLKLAEGLIFMSFAAVMFLTTYLDIRIYLQSFTFFDLKLGFHLLQNELKQL